MNEHNVAPKGINGGPNDGAKVVFFFLFIFCFLSYIYIYFNRFMENQIHSGTSLTCILASFCLQM